MELCGCGSDLQREALFDGYGIFMCYVCDKCRDAKLRRYRHDIFERYDTDEQIEPDE